MILNANIIYKIKFQEYGRDVSVLCESINRIPINY